MEKIIRLTKAHHKDFLNINKVIRETITNSSWFMPISIDHLENTFDAEMELLLDMSSALDDDFTKKIYEMLADGSLFGKNRKTKMNPVDDLSDLIKGNTTKFGHVFDL